MTPAPRKPVSNSSHRALLLMVAATAIGGPSYLAATRAGFPPVVPALIILATMSAIVLAMILWWRNADEAVREAHKSAWFWGGTIGLAALVPMLVFAGHSPQMLEPFAGKGHFGLAAAGVLAALLFQLAGYIVAWAAWWVRRR